jgi:hypothetical protein
MRGDMSPVWLLAFPVKKNENRSMTDNITIVVVELWWAIP